MQALLRLLAGQVQAAVSVSLPQRRSAQDHAVAAHEEVGHHALLRLHATHSTARSGDEGARARSGKQPGAPGAHLYDLLIGLVVDLHSGDRLLHLAQDHV